MSDNTQTDPRAQQIAEACAAALLKEDTTTQSLGMKFERIAPGIAVLSMRVADTMTNGHGTCHGGYLFTLADSAFAFACNTYNQRSVAQHCNISYLAPAYTGELLQATATEVSRSGRNGIYDVRIINEKHEPISEFRGFSRTVRGTFLPEEDSP